MTQRVMRNTTIAHLLVVLLLVVVLAPAQAQNITARLAFQRDAAPGGASANVVVMFTDSTTITELPASADLTNQRITPALTPDGHLLAFASQVGEHFKLFTWALDDQNNALDKPTRLSPDEDTDDKFPAWSPDGQRLAYLAIDANKKASLRIINKDGTDMKVLQEGITYFSTPNWSNNGDRLLYIDNVAGKPTLRSTSTENFIAINLFTEARIIAACYSPDGTHIAAIIEVKKKKTATQKESVTQELRVLSPSSKIEKGNTPIIEKISGCSSVMWLPSEGLASGVIVFNATVVGTLNDDKNNAFWFVNPETKTVVQSLPAYAQKNLVRYFSACAHMAANATATTTPAATDTTTQATTTTTATDTPTTATPVRVASGSIVITSPAPDAKLTGIVPLKINTQADVASCVLRISATTDERSENKYSYAIAVDHTEDAVTPITQEWDTQELVTVDPTRGIPAKYADFLRYPDGTYTLSVSAFDKENKPVGTDSIKVTIANSLPDDSLPPDLYLRYKYVDPSPEEHYRVHGEGDLAGAYTKFADALDATLDAEVQRDLVEARPNNYDVRTTLDPIGTAKFTLATQTAESSIPEQNASALYTLTQSGDLSVIPQRRKRIFLPLSQIVVPLPQQDTSVQVGSTWSKQMWVVPDLLAREAAMVHAAFTVDGVEMVNGDRTVRIRAEYHLDSPTGVLKLALIPATATPGLLTGQTSTPAAATQQALPRGYVNPMMSSAMSTSTGQNSIDVNNADGIRYAWFDIDKNKIVRMEDLVLYSLQVPYETPPQEPQRGKPATMGMPGNPGALPGALPGAFPGAAPDAGGDLPMVNVFGTMKQVQRKGMGFYVEGLGDIDAAKLNELEQQTQTMPGPNNPPPPTPGMSAVPGAPTINNTSRMVQARYLVHYSYRFLPGATE